MIHIVDYGVGNCGSIANMLSHLGIANRVSGDPADIMTAERLILPGVGAFDAGMGNLETRGLVEPLRRAVRERQTPLLGVCLGMQLLCDHSAEGSKPGLGLIKAHCLRFDPAAAIKVPHMSWAEVDVVRPGRLLPPGERPRFYFVHSYYVVCEQREAVVAEANHGIRFAAAIEQGMIFGVQFHPEKSHRFGMRLLEAFAGVPCARA
jgi:imidazole glycerol-phosphate synthase subunit HisH